MADAFPGNSLKAHLKQPLLIIRDGLKAHWSKLVREYLDSTSGHNPDNLDKLRATAHNKLKSAQHPPSIIMACWKQTKVG
jgi:hypothetical protein